MILGINSCSLESEVCLVDENSDLGRVVGEIKWKSNKDESEKLLPNIVKLLKDCGVEMADLSAVFVVKGPGSFVAVRLGCLIASTIANNLKIDLLAMDSFEFLSQMNEVERVIMFAGGKDIYDYNCMTKKFEIMIYDEKFANGINPHNTIVEVEGNKIKSLDRNRLDNVIIDLVSKGEFNKYKVQDSVLKPNYVKEPTITI